MAPNATRGRSVTALAVLAAVVVIVAALVGGVALNTRRQEADTSPQPSSAAVPVSPSAAGLVPDSGRALVVDLGGHGIGIRTEADVAPFFRGTSRTQHAVSATGKLAYWKTGADDALPHELHVYDTASRTDRTLLTLTDERGGSSGFMVWSTDGTGLAFGTSDPSSAYEGRLAPARPAVATWWLLDVGTGVRRKIATISDAWIMPVSWDRVTDTATAGDVGRDGPGTPTRLFYVWEPLRAKDKATVLLLPASIDPLTIHADTAGRSAVGLEPYGAAGFTGRNIWTWPLRDPTAGVPRKIPGRLIFQAQFRPGTNDVYALMRNNETPTPAPGPPFIDDLGPLALSGAREVYRTPHQGGDYFFFRSDGTAVVVGTVALNDRRGAVVDPDTGASTVLALDDDVLASIGPPPAQAVASPSPTAFPSGSPLQTQPPAGFATAEEAADAIKHALEGNPSQSLYQIVRPAGWYAQWLIDNAKTDPMTLGGAVSWITMGIGTPKRSVDARPILDTDPQHPLGEKYIRSLWLDFPSTGFPEQKADIMLGREGGRWFWTSVLFYRPPPISPAGGDSVTGYATLLAVSDATITVRFRTVGSRCCSDQSWDGKTVVLHPDSRTSWSRADGTKAPSAAATGATAGSDVWVEFAPSTLAPDGSYRLNQFAKMYP